MRKWMFVVPIVALTLALGAWSVPSIHAASTSTPNAGPARLTQYILPGDAVFPEGVAYQQQTQNFFVSSTTDGTIYRGDIREPVAEVFLPGGSDGRTTATGMKVDDNRLFISGAQTGQMFVYDATSGELLAKFNNGLAPSATFVNDVAVTKDGDAYFTDSVSPYLYRVHQDASGEYQFERFIDVSGTALQYQPGFNVNGIAASQNGKYLIVVQSNTGRLFRIDIATREVSEIHLGGANVPAGDGIALRGRTLYVAQNQFGQIAKIQLSGDLSSGRLVSTTADPSFAFPTTIAIANGRLLVVNSQFDKRGPGLEPELPFTVSSVRIP